MAAKYIALTTENYRMLGYHEVARGNNKEKVRAAAQKSIGPVATGYGTDIQVETRQRNLIIVTLSEAIKHKWV